MRTQKLDLECVNGFKLLRFLGGLLNSLVYILNFSQHRHPVREQCRRPGCAAQQARAERCSLIADDRRQGWLRMCAKQQRFALNTVCRGNGATRQGQWCFQISAVSTATCCAVLWGHPCQMSTSRCAYPSRPKSMI